jgi:hypothetical protein
MWNKCLWVGRSCWEKMMEFELVDKAWACKKNSSYKFSQSFVRKCLSQIHVSSCPVTSPRGGKSRHYWGSKRSKCQVATLYRSCISLSNEKQNVICTSCHNVAGMWLYKWRHQKPKWKDLRTSNVETQVQIDADGMKIREGIGLGWSQGIRLNELDVW